MTARKNQGLIDKEISCQDPSDYTSKQSYHMQTTRAFVWVLVFSDAGGDCKTEDKFEEAVESLRYPLLLSGTPLTKLSPLQTLV